MTIAKSNELKSYFVFLRHNDQGKSEMESQRSGGGRGARDIESAEELSLGRRFSRSHWGRGKKDFP